MPESIWPIAIFSPMHDRGIEAGAARALQIERRRFRREAAVEHAFAREIEILRMLEHRAGADVAETSPCSLIALDQRLERRGEHLLIARFGVSAHRAREGNAHAADDGDASN